jgi:SAM-dependent methyltransferase
MSLKLFIKKCLRISLFPFIVRDYFLFKQKNDGRFSLSLQTIYPQIHDKTATTHFDRHYVYHTAWAARVIKEINPPVHVDISSLLYFSTLVSAFVPVQFYDYRPADLSLSNFHSDQADLLHLPFADNSIVSLSCMHTLEHIGLGRYGDPVDPLADVKAIENLKRVLAPGGSLLIVVPIGKPKIEFNAHRIYSYEHIVSMVSNKEIMLKEFAFIPEHEGPMIRNADPALSLGADYACGCFWFIKKS